MSLSLVFELLCEQLPTKTMDDAYEYVPRQVGKGFDRCGISYAEARVLVTSHRISLIIKDLKRNSNLDQKEVKGPRVSSKEEAIDGFMKKVGVSSVTDLDVRDIGGEEYYFRKQEQKSSDNFFREVADVIQNMVDNFPLHKKMKWGNGIGYWVRPVINVLCVLEKEVLPISVVGIDANNFTYGNLRSKREAHTVTGVENYLSFLKKNMIIADKNERKLFLLEQLDKEISGQNLSYNANDKMIDELSGMLEYPKVFIGSVDEIFSSLPQEVILCVMTHHQRYIALYNHENRIVKFSSVANIVNDRVIKTHEAVLRARLSDAMFLIQQDKSRTLEYCMDMMSKIVFKSELGSMLDKVNRMSVLAKYSSVWIPHSSMLNVERAAILSKMDLATLVVREFPELQGIMGRYYAQHSGEDHDICMAMEEHYHPCGHNDRCPSSPTSVAVAIADKVDNLVGLMATEKMSGSRDPFAMRRTAISLLRVILENNISIPLDLILCKSVSLYLCNVKKNKNKESMFSRVDRNLILSMVMDFCYERLKVILIDMGMDKEVVYAVIKDYSDVLLIKKKAEVIGEYLKTDRGRTILSAYRRVSNIVKKTGYLKENKQKNIKCSEKFCIESCELELYHQIKNYEKVICRLVKLNSFLQAMNSLFEFSSVVNRFMDVVRVCDQERVELYKNRMNLSLSAAIIYESVMDFAKIPKDY